MASAGKQSLLLIFLIIVGLSFLILGLLSYMKPAPVEDESGIRLPPCRDCNVILISVEATRADHLDLYGYHRRTMPLLGGYAEGGMVFDNAFVQAPWTRPSMASLHTSLYSFNHGVKGATDDDFIRDSFTTLAEELSAAGFKTAAFVTISNVKSVFGFSQGFDHFDETDVFDKRAMDVNEHIKEWVKNNKDGRFFVWVHYIDPHDPYMPPIVFNIFQNRSYTGSVKPHSELAGLEWKECRRNLSCRISLSAEDVQHMADFYDGELRYVDFALDDLFSFLSDEGLFNKSLIMVTADHGAEFMDHGLLGHGISLYNEVVHVPLIVWAPRLKPGRAIKHVALVDIYPTVLSFVGRRPPAGIDGVDLFEGRHDYIIMENYLYPRTKKAVVKDGWKFILSIYPDNSTARELYYLFDDPYELFNLTAEQPAVARELESLIDSTVVERKFVEGAGRQVDEQTLQHLRSLGYII
jgi:arylsulfatase A-like enzyme